MIWELFIYFFILMGGGKFDRSETQAVPKPEIISLPRFSAGIFQLMHARLSVHLIKSELFPLKKIKKSMALKSGFHDFSCETISEEFFLSFFLSL